MGDIGIPELLIILAILLILFGPSRLSGLGRALGQNIREFRNGIRDETQQAAPPAAEADQSVNKESHGS
jgi:sec-independent protein translocase protein TatA